MDSFPAAKAAVLLWATSAVAAFGGPLPPQTKLGHYEFDRQWHATQGQPMPNVMESLNPLLFRKFSDFKCAWSLLDRPRTMALLVDDLQVEYEPYVRGIVPQVRALVDAFRAAGQPIFWSVWGRLGPDDGYFNTMDRYYGPGGIETKQNALYVYQPNGTDILPEVAPRTLDERRRAMTKFYSLDMFDPLPMEWFEPDGQRSLDAELQKLGVDTIVQVGAWTDDCIIATAFHAFALQFDVVVVSDGVSTASQNHFAALEVMAGAIGNVIPTAEVLEAMGKMYGLNASVTVPPETFAWTALAPASGASPSYDRGAAQEALRTAAHGHSTSSVTAPTARDEIARLANTLVCVGLGMALGFIVGRQHHDRSPNAREALLQ